MLQEAKHVAHRPEFVMNFRTIGLLASSLYAASGLGFWVPIRLGSQTLLLVMGSS